MPQPQALEGPLHFIGIGGNGMSGLAELALRRGFHVRGSDARASDATARLAALGIDIALVHDAANVQTAKTIVHSSAIAAGNVELAAAQARGLKILHRSELLAAFMEGKQPVTIAGTHGKSTTSAMVTHVLDALGCDPEAAIGGVMRRYDSTARAGHGELFVAEADESDGSFLRYRPYVAVVTNVDQDHMEYFKDVQGLVRVFAEHMSRVDPDGAAVVGWDSPLARQAAADLKGRRLAYGFLIGCDVRGLDYACDKGETRFTAMVEKDRVACVLPTIGRHNVQNALAALAVARALDLDVKQAAEALATFPGVDRRMTLVHKAEGIAVFDDYAHNPGKIEACVRALRESFKDRQLHVIYQPHRYSRLETMYDDMLNAVTAADFVHMLPVYSAGETTTRDFSPTRLAADLVRVSGVQAFPCDGFESAGQSVLARLARPAVILTVGAGDVWKVARSLKEKLA